MTDLKVLSRESGGSSVADGGSIPSPPRRWLTRLGLPGVIVLAVLALLAFAARDVLMPAREVSVVRAVALTGQATVNVGGEKPPPTSGTAVVAQAPGWVEPDPYPIYVTALADGVVEKVNVLEGQPVKAGQVLVELIDEDAILSLKQARAQYAKREAALAAAKTNFFEPIALARADAVAKAKLEEARAALARLDAQVVKEEARLAELDAAYQRLASLTGGAVSELQADAAKYQAMSQRAVVAATQQQRPKLEAQVDAAKALQAEAARDLELKTALRKVRDEAKASLDAAGVVVAEAELRLERMTIKSPIDGVVMLREVSPGSKLMAKAGSTHTADVVHLYDPGSMQVRVDVPLADAAAVGVGQRAVVVVDVLPDREFTGTVTRIVNRADIAKNTVQFKVALQAPSELLKPDMLARVKFFGRSGASAAGVTAGASDPGLAGPVAIQRSAVVDDGGGSFVWWISPTDRRIERRPITLGADRGDGLVEVLQGLNPADVLVDQPDASLREGQRVRYAELDGP